MACVAGRENPRMRRRVVRVRTMGAGRGGVVNVKRAGAGEEGRRAGDESRSIDAGGIGVAKGICGVWLCCGDMGGITWGRFSFSCERRLLASGTG